MKAVNYTVYCKFATSTGNTWDTYETVYANTEDEAKQIARKRIERKFGGRNGFEILEMTAE